MNVSKTILCGTALSAIVFGLPAQAQVTIGGDPIEVTDGVVTDAQNVGGALDLNGSDITDTSGSPVVIDDSAAVTGTLTVDRAIFAEGGVATFGSNINTGGGAINMVGGDIVGGDLISTGTLAVSGNTTMGGTLTVDRAVFAQGGVATFGSNINTGGGAINMVGGNIVAAGSVGTGTLAVTSNATIGQDLAVGRNLTVAGNITTTTGDIVTVSGDVVAGGIRLDSSTGRVTGVAAGVANTDAVNVGQLNAAVSGSLATVNARIDTLGGRVSILEDDARKAFQGVAMGFAMNAAPLNLANGEGGISAGAGIFEGEYAGAIRAQFVTETGFGIGANVGFSEDSVGGGVGASIKF